MDLLIGDIFSNAGRAVPDRVAAALGDRALTYGELNRTANRTARALARMGIGHRDRVAVWSATDLATVPLFAALAKLGAVYAPLNAGLGIDEAVGTVGPAAPALLVTDEVRADTGVKVAAAAEIPVIHFDALAEAAGHEDDGDVTCPALVETDPHVVFFTSGSTGLPKGAVLSHRVNFLRTHPGALLEPRGAMVSPYPLFHMGAWTIALQQWQAHTVVFLEAADAPSICAAIERHHATRLNAIPAVWRRILDHLASPAGTDVNVSSIRFADTGTSATPLELLEAMEAAFPNAQVRVFYGSTEAGSVAALDHADVHRKAGSCGLPAPFGEVKLSEAGEVLSRGPLLFDGYFGNEAATAEAMVDGWYRTGDVAVMDDEGYLSIVGRVRDIIRTGGESVAPTEVEHVLAEHPSVADVAVVGLPDQQWGEVVCAAVVLHEGQAAPTVEDLRSHCGGRLATYKHPRRVAVVDAIPRTASTNQIQRRLLVEQINVL